MKTIRKHNESFKRMALSQYDAVREKRCPQFKSISALGEFLGIRRELFSRWKKSWVESKKKWAPKGKAGRQLPLSLERTIISIRRRFGYNSYEIYFFLEQHWIVNPHTKKNISRSCIDNIRKRYPKPIKVIKSLRYEKENPGELGHIDVKKCKNVKWQDPKKKKYHAALNDDCTRITYCEVIPDKKAKTLSGFLKRATKWFKEKHSIEFKAIMTDNGKEFTTHWWPYARKHHSFEKMLKQLNIKHKYTRVRRPQTNGKIERFWRILSDEFMTKYTFQDWKDYNQRMHTYMFYFNNSRRHGWIGYQYPVQKLQTLTPNC